MPFGDTTTGHNASDINFAGVLSPMNSKLKLHWCVNGDNTLRGLNWTVDSSPNFTVMPLTEFGNVTEPLASEPSKCFQQYASGTFANATVYRGLAGIVGLTLTDTQGVAVSMGMKTAEQAKTTIFDRENQPIGLYGTSSKVEIKSLGFVAFNVTCESKFFSYSDVSSGNKTAITKSNQTAN